VTKPLPVPGGVATRTASQLVEAGRGVLQSPRRQLRVDLRLLEYRYELGRIFGGPISQCDHAVEPRNLLVAERLGSLHTEAARGMIAPVPAATRGDQALRRPTPATLDTG
jgi:hypothetical protein